MDQLENIASRAEQFEQQTADAKTFTQADSEAVAVPGFDPLEAAKNRASVILATMGIAAKSFIDQRLEMSADEIAEGREGLGPLLAKYNMVGDGDGKLPYQEEITAGLYIGGLWRRFRRALAHLREIDRAEAKRQQEQANGDQRKHEPQKQPQPIPGEERVRQEPDADSPRWLGGV